MRVQLSTYRRSLENKKVQNLIYSFALLYIILVLDVLGIYSLVRVTNRRLETYRNLSELNGDLKAKSGTIGQLKVKLDESKYYLSRLDVLVPKERMTEDYMIDMVDAAARNGLKQKGIKVTKTLDEYVEFRAIFQGPVFQIYPFIRSIESIDRLSSIREFDYSLDGETANLWASIRIYYLKR